MLIFPPSTVFTQKSKEKRVKEGGVGEARPSGILSLASQRRGTNQRISRLEVAFKSHLSWHREKSKSLHRIVQAVLCTSIPC
jgi:hypothetical protein